MAKPHGWQSRKLKILVCTVGICWNKQWRGPIPCRIWFRALRLFFARATKFFSSANLVHRYNPAWIFFTRARERIRLANGTLPRAVEVGAHLLGRTSRTSRTQSANWRETEYQSVRKFGPVRGFRLAGALDRHRKNLHWLIHALDRLRRQRA